MAVDNDRLRRVSIHRNNINAAAPAAAPPSSVYITLKPLIFFMFFSMIFMAVAVGILLLAILIVQLMLEK